MDFIPTDEKFENEYPKLVRDRIPEIILEKTGKNIEQKILDDQEYLKYLFKKIVEEAKELEYSAVTGNTQEELADVLELISALLAAKGWTMEEIVKVQNEKREKNGRFEKKILMLKKV